MAYYFPDPEQSLSDIAQRVGLISGISMAAMAIASVIVVARLMKIGTLSGRNKEDDLIRNDDLPGYLRFTSIMMIRKSAVMIPFFTVMLVHNTVRVIIPDNPGMLWGAMTMCTLAGVVLMLSVSTIFVYATDLANGFEARLNTGRARKLTAHFHKRRAVLLAQTPLNTQGASN